MDYEIIYNKFNRGEIDDLLLAREDVKRVTDSAALMNNFIPSRMGPMFFRQGMKYVGDINTQDVYLVPFFASRDSTAILEFTNLELRIWDAGINIVRSTTTSDSVTNGEFNTDLSGWVDADDAGTNSVWDSGTAKLTGNGSGAARIYQTITTHVDVEHTLRVVVTEAPIIIAIGTSGVDSDDIYTGTLRPGTHSLVFTPSSNVTITLMNPLEYSARVDSVQYASTADLILPTAITTEQLSSIRYTQSADVVFIAYNNGQQYRIERRGVKSWSIVDYQANDGPFGFINNTNITLRATALSGNASLIASDDYFSSDSVGELYRLLSSGQTVTESVTAGDNGTNSIRVTGVGDDRKFTVNATGVSPNTVTLQRSTDDVTWTDVETYTTNIFKTFNDELDNSILYYRLFVKSADYTSGTVNLTLTYSGGSIEGLARVISYTNATTVGVQIYQDFGSTEATRDWYKGQWCEDDGYPTSTALYEGRLWWAGKTRIWGSVSDSFNSFDDNLEGADMPIQRTIGFGPVDVVDWLAISSRLLIGVASDEISVRSSSFGEILTNTNVNLKSGSSQGVAPIEPVRIDDDVLFVQRAKKRLFRLAYSADRDTHRALDMMTLNESLTPNTSIKRIAVVRQPETRVIAVLENGNAIILTYDIAEDVQAWSRLDTNGDILDIVTLPSDDEDRIYFAVSRENGVHLEEMAKFSEVKLYPHDSFVEYSSPGTTLTGLSHLEGVTVSVWADNAQRGTYAVSSGSITLSDSFTHVVVGVVYEAEYISNKLQGLSKRKRIESVGMIARDVYRNGFTIGSSFTTLEKLPNMERGKLVNMDELIAEYDEPRFPFSGRFDVDSRVYIRANAPCKIMALTYEIVESTPNPNNNQR